MRILFVCTGNTCRSPLAERIMRKRSADLHLGVVASSAGTSDVRETAMSPESQRALARRDIDASGHQPRALKKEMIEEADYVLTMEKAHSNAARNRVESTHHHKIDTLGHFATGVDEGVHDPVGEDDDEYERCAVQLERLIEEACLKLRSKP